MCNELQARDMEEKGLIEDALVKRATMRRRLREAADAMEAAKNAESLVSRLVAQAEDLTGTIATP